VGFAGCNDPLYGPGLKLNCPKSCNTCPDGVPPTPSQLICLAKVACETQCINQDTGPISLLQAFDMPQAPADPSTCDCPAIMREFKKETNKHLAFSREARSMQYDRTKTSIHGALINTHTKREEPGVTCTWINTQTGVHVKATSDSKGKYVLEEIDRCGLYRVECYKEGLIPPGFGGSSCMSPYLVQKKHVDYTYAMMEYLEEGTVSAVLTWVEDDLYVKDLDLHLLVPGDRDVLLKDYAKYQIRNKLVKAQFESAKAKAKGDMNANITFNGTDISQKIDILDPEYHIFWDSKGQDHAAPYAKFQVDHGSIDGSATTGGPEVILIKQELPRQYALWVDCFSCDEYEDAYWGMDTKRYRPDKGETCTAKSWDPPCEPPFVKQSLIDFQSSGAIVRVFRGRNQMYCSSISNAGGHPTTRWDSMLIHPHKHIDEVYAGAKFNGHHSVLDSDNNVLLDHINQFKEGYPTFDEKFPQEFPLSHNLSMSLPAPVVPNIEWKLLDKLPYNGDMTKAIEAGDVESIKILNSATLKLAKLANMPYSGDLSRAKAAHDEEAVKLIKLMLSQASK